MKSLMLILILISPAAKAEIFTCLQADGTAVFAYVPCRVSPKKVTETTMPVEIENTVIEPQLLTGVDTNIFELESELDRLRDARESEIANAPFSVSEPAALAALKQDIRASYQLKIDDHLNELLRLRREKQRLKTDDLQSSPTAA
ncbi:MAG: hypothetical protein ACJAYE_001323 [Candidatus Azotimanducaceae bacterium]|jgi:hypothetical protein